MMTQTRPLPRLLRGRASGGLGGRYAVLGILGCVLLPWTSTTIIAAEFAAPIEHPSDQGPALPQPLPQDMAPGLALPPAPAPVPLIDRGGSRFTLNGIRLVGNTVFTDAELTALAEPFIGDNASVADLEEIRHRLTYYYIEHGYPNSGAVIEANQDIGDGIVTFLIHEGRLIAMEIEGNGWLRKGYLRNRLWPDPQRPFKLADLQDRFQMLLHDPLIRRMNGSIRPGPDPSQAILDLEVIRANPFSFSIGADNHRPPSTGAERLSMNAGVRNLTGLGDALNLDLGYSRGADELALGYVLPLSARDTRLTFAYAQSENSVLEEPLDKLHIDSEFSSVDVGLIHPLINTLYRTFELGASFSRRKVETFLDGESFPFNPPAEDDGQSMVSVLRLSQELVNRGERQALALRSTLNFGLKAFNATSHDDAPDGQFFGWLGQMQYSRYLPAGGRLILRGDLQLANDEMVPLERIAIGGARTVRGYRENELVRDNGYAVSLELRAPILYGHWLGIKDETPWLQLAPFTDYGTAWNRDQARHRDHLHSVGLGLLATPHRRFYGELYWAYAIEKPEDKNEYDLQDDGLHFMVTVNLL